MQIDLPIAEAYVPLRTKLVRSLEQHSTERLKDHLAEHEEDVDLADVFREADRVSLRGVVLLGEPGSGKTTGARQIAWRLASGESRPADLGLPPGITPVLLQFRKMSRTALAQKNGLKSFLRDETSCELAGPGLDDPGDALLKCDGGLLWILDGLDEVIDPAARAKVSSWVKDAVGQRPRDRFLVTCRFAGYFRDGVSLGPQFMEFHVRALDDEQVRRFVQDWFGAAYTLLKKPELASLRTSKLLEVLARPEYQTQKLRELCTNPLMLTILCIVFHDQQQDLPRDRAALYEECVGVLLQHWRREVYELELGRAVPPFDADAAQSVLARVAWWMHGEQNRTAATMEDLAAEAQRGLAEVAPVCGLGHDGAAFIQRMKDESGILAGDNDGRCGFLHLGFQEFLAADYAAREVLGRDLASKATESWWIEVALLALSRPVPLFFKSFFRELLAAGIVEDRPDVAERCLTESKSFSAAPFVEVLTKPESPQRVAAVLRLLRDRADQVPELAEIVRPLATSEDRATQGFAREILARLGVAPPEVADTQKVFVDPRTGITFVTIPGPAPTKS
ncbi:MAG: NACHT domain-containing protein, partial [Planctomycetes bacterium]|nr:NACHT domain-containing protein [Planctomycetota bacterium]